MQQQLFAVPAQIPDDIARMAHEQKLGAPQAESLWRSYHPQTIKA
jgi:hypothetical protein